MKRLNTLAALATLLPLSVIAQTNAPAPAASAPPPPPFTFFVTSVGSGNGANLGGLAGADAHCNKLAAQLVALTRTGAPT